MNREEILRNVFTTAIEDTIETLPYTIHVFQDPSYNLKKSIDNNLDFLLGAFFAQVYYSVYCSNKDIRPTIGESAKFNYELFSKIFLMLLLQYKWRIFLILQHLKLLLFH